MGRGATERITWIPFVLLASLPLDGAKYHMHFLKNFTPSSGLMQYFPFKSNDFDSNSTQYCPLSFVICPIHTKQMFVYFEWINGYEYSLYIKSTPLSQTFS